MIVLRSLLFNIAFYVNLAALSVFGLPVVLWGAPGVVALARTWGRTSLFLLRTIAGVKAEFRGLENIPQGSFIIAPKHQSIWETFALILFFDRFTFVLKHELTLIPFFGLYLTRSGQIAVHRGRGAAMLNEATRKAKAVLADGRQIFIFPDGTRRASGAPPRYKWGVAQIYGETGARCLPVALNSGLFWPRRSFLRRPGTIVVEFLPVIEPGLPKGAFLQLLQDRIETAVARLNDEAVAKDPSLAAVIAAGAVEKDAKRA